MPREGEEASRIRAFELIADDVVTCPPDERIGALRERVAQSRYGFAFVVSGERVLLGRLRRAVLEGDPDAIAVDVMEPGPSTIRADSQLEPLLERMRSRELTCLPVTDPDGRLLGLVRRKDIEAELTGREARN